MSYYNIAWEITISAESPLEAAKIAQKWMDRADNKWQFNVQDDDTEEVFSIDLADDEFLQVISVTEYKPIIR